ncbi:hypothetical protein Calab_2713 [Caldithrix abyssi DSM 13497]|uniref:Uncharacterized protein n=1 Tax=Caldithrix abyssi DSM 13497 TaxID=880073 RepID=H1XQP8_CALAY|nr:hypothetical protein Calab_2713 [Caldithrix abyssi DSM 13497]
MQDQLSENTPNLCPHCGNELTLWEQVLLSVDRMLVCRNCWYRIILDPPEASANQSENNKEDKEG